MGVSTGQQLSLRMQMRSNAAMSNPTDDRLTDLEIKASFMEDTLDRLNEVIVRQQQQIDLLTRELLTLREQQQGGSATPQRSLRDELPPHY